MKCEAIRVSSGSKYLLAPTSLLAKGQPFEIIYDIGSGINYKKKGL